jgi:hypothetical protein
LWLAYHAVDEGKKGGTRMPKANCKKLGFLVSHIHVYAATVSNAFVLVNETMQ